ncbi:hypothetical protein C1645_841421 [Glomus cerebriforme]|uniref:Uncharacterized protein n=1 Tax=Glomus cerebriforme TaxID=658196 RepID=A0A397S2V5_9GLOM|nr:hypothetical protein C1645_841421 [Glomus cerebriforme]
MENTSKKTITNLDTEKNIISNTYGNMFNNTINTQLPLETLSNIENTQVITTTVATSNRDIIMGNTIEVNNSPQSSSSSLPAITTPYQNLTHSIHALDKGKNVLHDSNTNQISCNTFNTLYVAPQTNDSHTTSNNELINNDFNDANNITCISDTENLTINEYIDLYLSFALLKDLPYNTINKIKTEILCHFLNNSSFRGFMGIQSYYGIKILKITFYDEAECNSIHNIFISKFNTRFYNYEPNYIEQIITPILEAKYNKTIKLVDIPKHIDNLIILEAISKEIGPIVNSYEPKSNPKRQNTNPNNITQFHSKKLSFFKQLKIEFKIIL